MCDDRRVVYEPARSDAAREAARAIARYAPESLSAAAAAFAREVVARAASGDAGAREGAVVRGRQAGRVRASGSGLSSAGEVVLCEAVIERFIVVGCAGVSPATRRTLRTNLRALARAIERYPQPAAGAAGARAREGAVLAARRSTGICGSRPRRARGRGGCARARWCVWAPARG